MTLLFKPARSWGTLQYGHMMEYHGAEVSLRFTLHDLPRSDGSSHWVPWLPWVPWVRLGPGPGHAPFESKTGNAQETYGLVKRGIETVHFPSSVKLQVRHMGTGDKQYQGRKMLEIGGIRSIYLIYFETRGSKEGWPWFWTHCAAEATKFSMCFICVSCFSLFLCLDYHSKYQGIRRHPI